MPSTSSAPSDAEVLLVLLGQPDQPPPQHLHLRRRGPLLGTEHLGGVGEAGPHVAGDQQFDAPVASRRPHGPERSEAAVGGGRAADRHDHASGAHLDGLADQLAGAGSGGVEGLVLLSASGQQQPRRRRHLDDRRRALEAPARLDGLPQRAGHGGAAVGPAQNGERALATVGHRQRRPGASRRTGAPHHSVSDLGGGGGAPELVGSGDDVHRAWPTDAAGPCRGAGLSRSRCARQRRGSRRCRRPRGDPRRSRPRPRPSGGSGPAGPGCRAPGSP